MPNIYDQHHAAFAQVSAFIIAKDGQKVATVAIKFPKDGASRLYAYAHWLGVPMVRGFVNGYGYDKRSAAVSDAAERIDGADGYPESVVDLPAFKTALAACDGQDWTRALEQAGFTVWQAV